MPLPTKTVLLEHDDLRMDVERHLVTIRDQEVSLSPTEFDLLRHFLRSRGRVVTRVEIIKKVWRGRSAIGTRTVDQNIKRMREKIGADRITTLAGVGYRIRLR